MAWLRAPTSTASRVADNWLAAEAKLLGGTLEADVADGGLLPDLTALDGPGFAAADLAPAIRDATGTQLAAGWLRTLRSTGEYVYSGCYSHRLLPGATRPSVHVAFPLEHDNVQVFLQPFAEPDGSLRLESPGEPFGGHGAYVVVEDDDATYAARAPVRETFRLYVDSEGVLRTDHDLRMWNATAVRLHYKLERRAS